MRRHRCSVLGLATILLAGCGSHAGTTPAPSAQAMRHPVIVANASGKPDAWYRPDPIRVRVGQTITWKNTDGDPHDVTARSGLFASGPIPTGGVYHWTPAQPGTYSYFCTLHPEMHGIIIVHA
jgi:plastocyanin